MKNELTTDARVRITLLLSLTYLTEGHLNFSQRNMSTSPKDLAD
jgi:hypothetical protein